MHGNLGGRKFEDQPAGAGVDVRVLEHVSKESAVGFGVGAVDESERRQLFWRAERRIDFRRPAMTFRGGPSPRAYDPPRRGDRPMRKPAASLFLSLDGAAERPDEFVTDVDDATEQTLRSVSR
jgi:hypothetical protein